MMATKEQERKALAQIKKIVDGLGENSYIGMAFEGCFEIAEENIESDFGCSMKQRAEKAGKDAEYFKAAAENFSAEADRLREERDALKAREVGQEDLLAAIQSLSREATAAENEAETQAEIIVEFADTPDSPAFRDAVKKHRENKEKATRTREIIKRLTERAGA